MCTWPTINNTTDKLAIIIVNSVPLLNSLLSNVALNVSMIRALGLSRYTPSISRPADARDACMHTYVN